MSEPNHPDKEFKAGHVSLACWKHEVEKDGRILVRWSTKLQNRIRDRTTGEWRNTDCYYPSELADLILVAQHAMAFVRLRESEENSDLPTVAT